MHSFLGRSREPDFTNNIELLSALLSDSETQTLNDILRKAFHKIGYPKLFDDFGMKTGQSEFSVKQIALIKLIAPNLKSLLSGSGDESELLKFISWVQEI